MRGIRLSLLVAGTLLAGGWVAVAAQTTTTTGQAVEPEPSVADAARKARADKKTEPQSAKRVWTDDNIPKNPHDVPTTAAIEGGSGEQAAPTQGATSPIGAMQAAKGAAAAEQAASSGAASGTSAGADDSKKRADLEAKWRERFALAYKKLDDDQKDADLMQREYNLKRQQYYSDPNTALREQYQYPSGRGGELNDMAKKIDEKKAQIEQDKQAISDLEDALRKEGLPPGWARP